MCPNNQAVFPNYLFRRQAENKNCSALAFNCLLCVGDINADETKYMVMYRDQNTRRSHNIKTDNSSFERMDEFKYFGTTLTNQNSIQEEIKSRLKAGNACYHEVQNFLTSSLLSRIIKIKIYKTILFPVFLYECETWSLTLGRKVG